MTPQPLLQQRYLLHKPIGTGGHSTVYSALDRHTNTMVAVKRIKTDYQDREILVRFDRECAVLASLQHPSIPRYLNHFEEAGELYLVMELVDGTPLGNRRGDRTRFSEQEATTLLQQMGEVLELLHNQYPPILHRDIHPKNILRRIDGRYVLVDFGLAKANVSVTHTSVVLGTPGYAAPELLTGEACAQSDIYSLGVTVLCLLTGLEPGVFSTIRGQIVIPDDLVLSPVLHQVVASMISLRIQDRPRTVRQAYQLANNRLREQSTGLRSFAEPVVGVFLSMLVCGGLVVTLASYFASTKRSDPAPLSPSPSPPKEVVSHASATASVNSTIVAKNEACERWLLGISSRSWPADTSPQLGNSSELARRITLRTLTAADLMLTKKELPCSHDVTLADKAWTAYVESVRGSRAAWTLVTKADPVLLSEIAAQEQPLAPGIKVDLVNRIETLARSVLSSDTAEGYDDAQGLCAVGTLLRVSKETPSCERLSAHQKSIKLREEQEAKKLLEQQSKQAKLAEEAEKKKQAQQARCERSQQAVTNCQIECTSRYDLFSPKLKLCDELCHNKFALAGCEITDIPD